MSSQTLPNLALIDQVTETLVLRPLATSAKQEIIDTAKQIGTEEFSRHIPEYCAVISDKPTTHARPEKIAAQEARFNFAVLDAAITNAHHQLITEVAHNTPPSPTASNWFRQQKVGHQSNNAPPSTRHKGQTTGASEASELRVLSHLPPNSTIIDVRHPAETAIKPLPLTTARDVLNIPFYALRTRFNTLDPNHQYLLYCDQGLMSRLHAAHLLDEGFSNVAVLEL